MSFGDQASLAASWVCPAPNRRPFCPSSSTRSRRTPTRKYGSSGGLTQLRSGITACVFYVYFYSRTHVSVVYLPAHVTLPCVVWCKMPRFDLFLRYHLVWTSITDSLRTGLRSSFTPQPSTSGRPLVMHCVLPHTASAQLQLQTLSARQDARRRTVSWRSGASRAWRYRRLKPVARLARGDTMTDRSLMYTVAYVPSSL